MEAKTYLAMDTLSALETEEPTAVTILAVDEAASMVGSKRITSAGEGANKKLLT
jgi:hypothetical protein